jgi:hypothetical protein
MFMRKGCQSKSYDVAFQASDIINARNQLSHRVTTVGHLTLACVCSARSTSPITACPSAFVPASSVSVIGELMYLTWQGGAKHVTWQEMNMSDRAQKDSLGC